MIYLDHHAATPVCGEAQAAMEVAHRDGWANPSSVHGGGRRAKALLEAAREQVASALMASPSEIVLTSGGTEACNLGVLGLSSGVELVVTSGLEHPAVGAAVDTLVGRGIGVHRLDVGATGSPDPAELDAVLHDAPRALVALQWVNHETGTCAPIAALAAICGNHGAALVVDACQAAGKVELRVPEGVTALIVASAKIGGPAGAAALWARRDVTPEPLLVGGGQERGRRAGTLDVAAQAGFGAACTMLPSRLAAAPAIAARRGRLEAALVAKGAVVNGAAPDRVATVTNVSIPRWRGDQLVAALDVEGLCASAGAACSSGVGEPSPVLRALYPEDPRRAESALRLSLGPETADADIESAIEILVRVLPRA